jgi:hypothetical protein
MVTVGGMGVFHAQILLSRSQYGIIGSKNIRNSWRCSKCVSLHWSEAGLERGRPSNQLGSAEVPLAQFYP